MTLKEILSKIESSENPVIKIIHKNESFKVIGIGFRKGAILKEHKTALPAKLTVIKGEVCYKQSDFSIKLKQFDEHEIPVNIFHSVEANEDSLCILTQG